MFASTPRIIIGVLSYLFALNHLVLGLPWMSYYSDPQLAWIPYVLYLFAMNFLILPRSERKIPLWQAGIGGALAFSISTLSLANLNVDYIPKGGSYATWFVGGVSTLFAIIAVRGHRNIAWMGVTALCIQCLIWGGFENATTMGIVGAIMLVGSAIALSAGFESTLASAQSFEARAKAAAARSAALSSGARAREEVLESALDRALPTLRKIVRDKGELSKEAREDTEVLVLELRDELLGRNLLSAGVRIAVKEARARGVKVILSDEGGLDNYPPDELPALHASIARAIDGVNEGTVNIRAPKDENYNVAIVAQRPNALGPDVWLRLS